MHVPKISSTQGVKSGAKMYFLLKSLVSLAGHTTQLKSAKAPIKKRNFPNMECETIDPLKMDLNLI